MPPKKKTSGAKTRKAYRGTGMLYWTFLYWPGFSKCPSKDIWTDSRSYHFKGTPYPGDYPGDGSLLYPGRDVGYKGPVGSLRFKALRDGFEV